VPYKESASWYSSTGRSVSGRDGAESMRMSAVRQGDFLRTNLEF
jgi:hypothetical protein